MKSIVDQLPPEIAANSPRLPQNEAEYWAVRDHFSMNTEASGSASPTAEWSPRAPVP